MPSPLKRSCYIVRARVTRSRMPEEGSPTLSDEISLNLIAGISM